MQAEPERRPRRQRVYKGSVAPICRECRRRQNAWDVRDIGRWSIQLTPPRFDAANRTREQAAAHPRNGIKPDAWIGKALPDVTGLGGGPVHNRCPQFSLSVIRRVKRSVTRPRNNRSFVGSRLIPWSTSGLIPWCGTEIVLLYDRRLLLVCVG